MRLFAAGLLLCLLAGCGRSIPVAPVTSAASKAATTGQAMRAEPAPGGFVVSTATQTHSSQHLVVNDVYTVVGHDAAGQAVTLVATYFYKPWAGMGFTNATANGTALAPAKAADMAAQLRAATLAPDIDASAITGALQLLDRIAQLDTP